MVGILFMRQNGGPRCTVGCNEMTYVIFCLYSFLRSQLLTCLVASAENNGAVNAASCGKHAIALKRICNCCMSVREPIVHMGISDGTVALVGAEAVRTICLILRFGVESASQGITKDALKLKSIVESCLPW